MEINLGMLGANGPATSAELSCPVGAARDTVGNFYFSDANSVFRVTNGILTRVAGQG